MRRFVEDMDRGQSTLLPERLENWIGEDNAVRVIDVFVEDGKVKLVGTIFDDRQRDAVRVAAENIPGVNSVEDQLAWIEPTSGMVIGPRAA